MLGVHLLAKRKGNVLIIPVASLFVSLSRMISSHGDSSYKSHGDSSHGEAKEWARARYLAYNSNAGSAGQQQSLLTSQYELMKLMIWLRL